MTADYSKMCPKCGTFNLLVEKEIQEIFLYSKEYCPSCGWGQSGVSLYNGSAAEPQASARRL